MNSNILFERPHLVVDDATVTYNNGHTAIYDASFSITGGTICALVGINGSGKSTLFKTIMGLVSPSQGKVTLSDMPVKNALKKNIIAYVPQTEEVDWNFPVLVSDVVMMGRYGKMGFLRIPSKRDHQAVDKALERVGLTALRNRQIGELSGGQKKRVFLARALAQEGKVLLLDEPFTGVDVKTENAIIDLLCDLRDEGHLVLVSTHNLGSVPEFCDHVILINRTVLASGPTETTFTQKNLEMTFGGVLRHINLSGPELHDDDDPRSLTVITDDERAAVFYGRDHHVPPRQGQHKEKRQS
ncbi:manganese/iron ABC transporter ATP-binding protein [Photorhabdus laumondii subsp. laumondii]|uniref:Iron transport system ATP-binding protein YfeB n=3 Tax=Photorhabdus laumondii TaxID=2218628 RepID=Q7N3P2_PHOLL|nr:MULTISPECIES: manganese/iron ABC transporter ATP-binding protein [Photorhabdus]PQQ39493.1 manganese/iron ABC transporter ATP-binding protein [Photorhabdus luminescens]AWK42408.1 iron ABC transporter permease [Photorhabdus laumondii subsp. laumondii]AXG43254.1 iron ABC transporter permease [Photorhabdus laumondii subsp. laumondii]AXG47725.1 iron ABC transporter permease [Photorhabdus laumondii subsp. laumondii]KTL63585.1 iron ABC transporter permease [Photorhabdus laumondii subsp. laumondii]